MAVRRRDVHPAPSWFLGCVYFALLIVAIFSIFAVISMVTERRLDHCPTWIDTIEQGHYIDSSREHRIGASSDVSGWSVFCRLFGYNQLSKHVRMASDPWSAHEAMSSLQVNLVDGTATALMPSCRVTIHIRTLCWATLWTCDIVMQPRVNDTEEQHCLDLANRNESIEFRRNVAANPLFDEESSLSKWKYILLPPSRAPSLLATLKYLQGLLGLVLFVSIPLFGLMIALGVICCQCCCTTDDDDDDDANQAQAPAVRRPGLRVRPRRV